MNGVGEKSRMSKVTLSRDNRVIVTLAVPFDQMKNRQIIDFKGTFYVRGCDYLMTEAEHDDPGIDWRERVNFDACTGPLEAPREWQIVETKP